MEITNLKVKAEADKSAAVLHEQSIKEQYENKLNFAQQQVEYYKDLKSKMSPTSGVALRRPGRCIW